MSYWKTLINQYSLVNNKNFDLFGTRQTVISQRSGIFDVTVFSMTFCKTKHHYHDVYNVIKHWRQYKRSADFNGNLLSDDYKTNTLLFDINLLLRFSNYAFVIVLSVPIFSWLHAITLVHLRIIYKNLNASESYGIVLKFC